MQNYPPPVSPPLPSRCFSVPVSCPVIVRMKRGEVKWIENQLAECFCLFHQPSYFPKAFQLQRSSVNRFTVGDHGTVWSIQMHHQGLLPASLRRRCSARCSPSRSHFSSPRASSPFFSIPSALFREGCPPHSAVSEIKGMSMFIWHTESQSWLNSLTMRQMCFTVARETKLTLGGALCVKSCQEAPSVPFQWEKGQTMQHSKGEDDCLFKRVEFRDEDVFAALADGTQMPKRMQQSLLSLLLSPSRSCSPVLAVRDEHREGTISSSTSPCSLYKYKRFKGWKTWPFTTSNFIFFFEMPQPPLWAQRE